MTRAVDNMHLVDWQLRSRLAAFSRRPLTTGTLAATRNEWLPLPVTPGDGVIVEERHVSGPPGAPDVGLLVYRPPQGEGPLPTILHIHGGGYVMGSARHFEASNRALVSALGCAIVSVDYRLAPETIFPGAIEDCYAGLAWTFAQAAEFGFDIRRVGVMGESAGGGLAAATALLARDRGEYSLAFQHLIYPMLDDRTCTIADPNPSTGQFIWTAADNAFGWRALLGHAPGLAGVSPYAAAARAEDFAHLPPTYIHTGALDLFLDENLDYARRLTRAGVSVELHVWPGAFHGFDIMPDSEVARRAISTSRDALRRSLSIGLDGRGNPTAGD